MLEGLLFGVTRLDPVAFSVGPALLLLVAVLASALPALARRQRGTDGSAALRAGAGASSSCLGATSRPGEA